MSEISFMLKFRPFQTSSVWEFTDPDSGRKFQANDRQSLIRLIVNYRAQNSYPLIENLDLVLDHYLCKLPTNVGKCAPYFPLERGFGAFYKGGVALLKSLLYKSFASQTEADRRSDICVACPYNVNPDNSPRYIRWSDALAKASVGSKRSKNHDKLFNCSVCTCCLKAKVFHIGDMGLTDEEKNEMKKVNCWQTES